MGVINKKKSYSQKKKIKNINVSGTLETKNALKSPTNYFNRNFIIILSILVSFIFVQKEIIDLESDVHWGDEALNMLTVKNIVATGLPVYGTFANSVTSPLYNKDAQTVVYWEYAVELYLRTPIFLVSKLLDFHWEYYSSTIYLYLLFVILIFYYSKYKELYIENKLPFMPIAFFVLIFAVSKYSTSQFHNVRSYSFTIMAIPLAHLITHKLFLYSKLNPLKRYSLILLLSFLPSVFHLANLIYFAYWLIFLIIYFINNSLKNGNGRLSIKSFFLKNLKYLLFGLLLMILLGYLGKFILNFLKSRLFFSSENINIIPAFFSFYFSKNFILYNVIFVLLLLFSIINIKIFNKYERILFQSSLFFIIFCLIGFSIIGGQGIVANPYAYIMFMFPIIILIISLMLTNLFKSLINLLPNFYLKDVFLFSFIAFLFIFINYKKFEENEGRSDGTREELESLLYLRKTYQNLVFVTSKNAHYFYNYLPENKAYLLRDYQNINESNIIIDDYYRSSSGWTKDIGGEIFVGKFESFCRMLSENIDRPIYFHRIMPQFISKDLIIELNKVIVGNPSSAKYLMTMLCSQNDSIKTKNILELIRQNGLFEEEYISLGAYLYDHNYYAECINSCFKALSINPNNTHALLNLGVCYIKTGKWKDAILMNEKALSIDPNLETAKKNLEYAKQNLKSIRRQ